MPIKTYSAKPGDIDRHWILIDAENLVLGRLAALIASRLRGKHRPQFTPHIDCGDHVVVINAGKVALTGKKHTDKIYHRHTGYPGSVKSTRAGDVLEGKYPERVLLQAVKRMLPGGPLGRQQFKKLRVYAGDEHPHEAQNPEPLDVAALNKKYRRVY